MGRAIGVRSWIEGWPVYRQLTSGDLLGRGEAAWSQGSPTLRPCRESATVVARSVRPYRVVGCGQLAYAKDGRALTQIEGDPDSPISRERLCPKGAASNSSPPRCAKPGCATAGRTAATERTSDHDTDDGLESARRLL